MLNAFYIGCIETTERIFKQAGLPVKNESNALKEAFNRCFFREDKGIYVDSEHSGHSSLHSNCLPVFFGINPRESNDSIARLLIKKGMRCSVYMSFFFLKALSALGKHEHVYRLITSKSKNSWYNMISEGATACFEAWGKEQKWNTSLCHPWASAPVTLLIEDLIGLKVNRGEVTSVVPKLPKDLKNLEITVPLKSEDFHFKYSSGEFSYKITRRASD